MGSMICFQTRPWVNFAKVHVTKRSGLVWSEKGCNLCMWSLGRRKKPFSCVWGMVTNCKPDDPKASRILTSEVFCKNMDGSYSHLHFSKIKHAHLVLWPNIKSSVFFHQLSESLSFWASNVRRRMPIKREPWVARALRWSRRSAPTV